MTSERAPAVNEALHRDVNARVRELVADHGGDGEAVPFVCECATVGCGGVVALTLAEYARVRSTPRTFALAPGHERPGLERVLERSERYVLVEKTGEAGATVEELA